MKIGELARRTGLSVKTLRYYEDIGVLPAPERTPNGYRDFDEGTFGRLEFVRAAQAVGLTLGEIREVIGFRERGEVPCSHVLDVILHHAAEVDHRIAELQRLRADLEHLARRARTLDPNDCPAPVVCHVLVSSIARDAQEPPHARRKSGSRSDVIGLP
jgi:DNA-binding transcriptional MerR regulator